MGNRAKEILLLCLAVLTLVVAVYTFRSKPAGGGGGTEQAQAASLASAPRLSSTPVTPVTPVTRVKKTGMPTPDITRRDLARARGHPASADARGDHADALTRAGDAPAGGGDDADAAGRSDPGRRHRRSLGDTDGDDSYW